MKTFYVPLHLTIEARDEGEALDIAGEAAAAADAFVDAAVFEDHELKEIIDCDDCGRTYGPHDPDVEH